jgi:DNA-binding MarR family transcriptional regulator
VSRAAQPVRPARRPGDARAPAAVAVVEAFVTTGHLLHRFAERRLAELQDRAGQADAVRCRHELSVPRIRLLVVLGEAGRMRMGDLAAELEVTARNVTTMVDALEKEGLLARKPDPTDRRATLLELTPTGRAHFDQLQAMQCAIAEEVLAPLDAGQRRQLLDLLNRLKDGVPAAAGDRFC